MIEEQQDYSAAAGGYLVWPLALIALVREDPAASRWSRIHARQALTFGLTAGIGFLIILALPLLVTIADVTMSSTAIVAVYAAGLLLDAISFIVLMVLAFTYAARAGRGELFTIPVVSALADRFFRVP